MPNHPFPLCKCGNVTMLIGNLCEDCHNRELLHCKKAELQDCYVEHRALLVSLVDARSQEINRRDELQKKLHTAQYKLAEVDVLIAEYGDSGLASCLHNQHNELANLVVEFTKLIADTDCLIDKIDRIIDRSNDQLE